MADASPQPNQSDKSAVVPDKKEQVGSLVERLRSYESDVARLKGVALAPVVPEKKPEIAQPRKNTSGIAGDIDPYVEANGNSAKSLEATNTIVSDVVREDPKKAVEALHKESPIQQFRTIQTDVATASQHKSTAIEDIIAKEQHKTNRPIVIEDPKRSYFILMLSGLMLLGGFLALAGYYIVSSRGKLPTPIVVDTQNVVSIDASKELIFDGTVSLQTLLANARKQAPGTKNELLKFVIKQSSSTPAITGSAFATAFSPTIPAWLARTFGDIYFAGLYNGTNGWQPVMIFKVDSYETGYAGMLKWEETIADEFKAIAPSTPTVIAPVATSTSTTTPNGFKDTVIKNKDVRILQDASGHNMVLYSFADQQTLVITNDQAALEEVFARLNTSKFVR